MIMIIGSGLIVACVSFFIAAVQSWTMIAGLFFFLILGLLYLLHDFLDTDYFHENHAQKNFHRVGLSYFIDRNTGLPVNVKTTQPKQDSGWDLSQLSWLKSGLIKVQSIAENGRETLPQSVLEQLQQPSGKPTPRYPLQTYKNRERQLPDPQLPETPEPQLAEEPTPKKQITPHSPEEFRKSALENVVETAPVNPVTEQILKKQGHAQISVISVSKKKVSGSTLQLLDQLNVVLPKPASKDLIIVDSLDPRHHEKGLVSHLNNTYEYDDIICEGLLSDFDVIPGVGRNWLDFSIRMNHFFAKTLRNYDHVYIVCSTEKEALWKSSVNTLSSLQTTVFHQPLNHDFR